MNILKIIIILTLVLKGLYGLGQTSIINGTIIDSETKKPVEFASVIISGTSIGALSDENGKFSIQNVSLIDGVQLLVSHIAYEKLELKFENSNKLNIKLQPTTVNLDEVTVKPVNIKKFMKEVIQHHHNTMQKDPYMSKGFIREYAILNGKYLAFYDAYGYLISAGYDSYVLVDNFDFVPINFRKAKPNNKWFEYGFKAEENASNYEPITGYSALFSNFRHIEESYFLSEKKWDKYEYSLDSTIYNNGATFWIINFKPKNNKKKYYDSGSIYLNPENKNISKIKVNTSFFSFPFHKWVKNVSYTINLVTFNDKNYFAGSKASYIKDGLQHTVEYRLTQLNFRKINISKETHGLLAGYDHNPIVYYDSLAWKQSGLSEFSDIEKVKQDLSPNESLESQFKSFNNTYYRRKENLKRSRVNLFIGIFSELDKMFFSN